MSGIFYSSYAALWLLVIFQSLVLLGIVRTVYRTNSDQSQEVTSARNGRLIGEPLPKFAVVDVSGRLIDEAAFSEQPGALLFVTPDCTSCGATLEELEALSVKVDGNVVVVCRAGIDECKRLRATYRLTEVPVIPDEHLDLSELFDVHFAPTAVLLDAEGRVRTYGHPMRSGEVVDLMSQTKREHEVLAHQGDGFPG